MGMKEDEPAEPTPAVDTSESSRREGPLDGPAATSSLEARERIIDALRLDLVGPELDHDLAEETLHGRQRPSNWYLTGFLIPADTELEARGDDDADEDFDEVDQGGTVEESSAERKSAKKGYFPSSMGLSFLVAPEASLVDVEVTWGDYVRDTLPGRKDGEEPLVVWKRQPRQGTVGVDLGSLGDEPQEFDVPGSGGLRLTVLARELKDQAIEDELPKGVRSMSVFLVNRRAPLASQQDLAYAFQPRLTVRCEAPFVPRPDLSGRWASDADERTADLHFSDAPELATGHGVSADWTVVDEKCREVRSEWIPRGDVERTVTAPIRGVELLMEELGKLADGAAVRAALQPLVTEYRAWIAASNSGFGGLPARRKKTAEGLIYEAEIAAQRIEAGIELLAGSSPESLQTLDAFRTANRAVARALRQRLNAKKAPEWRAFQLAFLLLNVQGVAEPTNPQREIVDLLFFPTGGGKTEAYLGLAAYTMVLRRLRNPGLAGAGVSVLMRYTLRLLTFDQLGRAAGLVCALELERLEDPDRLGPWPFEIGLWVGKAATPNRMGRKSDKSAKKKGTALSKTEDYKSDPKANPSPIPLESCPWCQAGFQPDSFSLEPNTDQPRRLRVRCVNIDCDFSGEHGLPIVAVDEELYRRLPAFLISTVDKFASLPFTGETGLLMGGASRHDAEGFYGPMAPKAGKVLPQPLLPPDLVIQDELHLISGPMGTMAGLYETALEALATRFVGDTPVRPKIVASTATARRADTQVRALFGRSTTKVFPPPGVSRRDSFFAKTLAPSPQDPARSYIGITAPGRNPKAMYRRVMTSLMAIAQQEYKIAGGFAAGAGNVVDPYMTVLSYFNALRELGGARRILEEEVQNTLKSYGWARHRPGDTVRRVDSRLGFREPVELTSRVSTSRVANARRRLEAPYSDDQSRVDCALATNMISVGLDIPRLGLMVVTGQPKTHSEYIQASSRVGREREKPGLVITLLNAHKPRDRSHYERFRHYHETFYRSVEASSVTPFSARALDRGLAGALVGLARHRRPELTPPDGPARFEDVAATLREEIVKIFQDRVRRAVADEDLADAEREVRERIEDLSDAWISVLRDWRAEGKPVLYQPYEVSKKDAVSFVREMLDEDFRSDDHRKFRANRSLRDVESQVQVELHEMRASGAAGDGQ